MNLKESLINVLTVVDCINQELLNKFLDDIDLSDEAWEETLNNLELELKRLDN
jgi:hypothetical protein